MAEVKICHKWYNTAYKINVNCVVGYVFFLFVLFMSIELQKTKFSRKDYYYIIEIEIKHKEILFEREYTHSVSS